MKHRGLIIKSISLIAVVIISSQLLKPIVEKNDRIIAKQEKIAKLKHWKTTKEGVRYYETCINSKLFYVAAGYRGGSSLAGPVGDCKE